MNIVLGLIVIAAAITLSGVTLMCLMIWEPGGRQ